MSAKSLLSAATGGIPTLLVLAAIAGIAYVGHSTDWTMPSASRVFGQRSQPVADDWCAEHGVPESTCVQCKGSPHGPAADEDRGHDNAHADGHDHAAPAKAATDKPAVPMADWCAGHGVPESVCTRCNPELIAEFKTRGDWCAGHNLPESQCLLCNPELKARFEAMAPRTDANANGAAKGDRIVQLASGDVARSAGIEARPAEVRAVTQRVEANAEVRYDQTRYAQVAPRVPGSVAIVRVQAGQRVKRGDVLALIDSVDVGRAKADFLTAAASVAAKQAAFERVRSSTEQGFRNRSDLLAAEAELREAGIRLFNARQTLVNLGFRIADIKPGEVPEEHSVQMLGLPESIRGELDPHQTTANLIPVVAPLDGVVVSRTVVEGEVTEVGKPMFVVADTSRMWLKLDLPLSELASVRIGQEVSFVADGLDATVAGKVFWISTEVDDRTRTVEVRAEVPNSDGRLLANMFGRASISVAVSPSATVVPASAVQQDGSTSLVFVQVNDEVYLARTVERGIRDGDFVEVKGVAASDRIAVSGSYALLAQLNRGKLGAGCADEH